jgi:ribonuclease BN (tRNA processing enzyme)
VKWIVLGYQSPYPGPGGATPSYLLQTDEGMVLIDCGSAAVEKLHQRTHCARLAAVILSHLHHDHMCDLFILQYAIRMAILRNERTVPLPVYAPAAPKKYAELISYKNFTVHYPVASGRNITLIGCTITFFPTSHNIPCYAMRIDYCGKSIVYGADAGPDSLFSPYADDCDLIVLEATYREQDLPKTNKKRTHLSAGEAGQIAANVRARRLLLTHLYPEFDKKDYLLEAKKFFHGEILLPECQLEIEV